MGKKSSKLKPLKYGKAYSPSRYAKGKGVDPSRITFLRKRDLEKDESEREFECKEFGGKYFPVHSKKNDKIFAKAAHNANRIK